MNEKRNIISVIGLIGIHVISYFVVLPIAQNLENHHYGDEPFVLLYVALVIALPFLVFKHYKENNAKIFRILIHAIMLSLIGWAIKFLFLECSVCSMGG